MRVRFPAILRDVQAMNPDYPPPILAAIDRLHDEIVTNRPMRMLDLPAPDYDIWAADYAPHAGETWLSTHWFFAETLAYRRLIEAIRWWETGRDPFLPKKAEELASEALWTALDDALKSRALPRDERLAALIVHMLWGNRIDLSYAVSVAHGGTWVDDDLLIGEQEQAAILLAERDGDVHIVLDNTGTELAMDLVFADALLDNVTERVMLHVKMHPTFVSDATASDVLHFINVLTGEKHGEAAHALGRRLHAAFEAGRLRLAPDLFWNSSRFLRQLPNHLRATFEGARLVVFKGDLNYRRVVGDALWPEGTQLSAVVEGFPAPVMLVRTMKSDPIIGLSSEHIRRLDANDDHWRFNGKRGVIQVG